MSKYILQKNEDALVYIQKAVNCIECQFDTKKFLEYVYECIKHENNVELSKLYPPRSNRQNAFFHAIIGGYAANFGYTLKEVKFGLIKKRLCKDIFFIGTRKNMFGEEEDMYRSTKALDTKEFRDVIERFRNMAATNGFFIPDPDDVKQAELFRIHCLREIEANKDFLFLDTDEHD